MIQINVIHAEMTKSDTEGYVGKVQFGVQGHTNQYELVLQSKRGRDWGYGLFFLNQSGNEDELLVLEEQLEEDDELFDMLVQTAKEALVESSE